MELPVDKPLEEMLTPTERRVFNELMSRSATGVLEKIRWAVMSLCTRVLELTCHMYVSVYVCGRVCACCVCVLCVCVCVCMSVCVCE